MRRFLQGSKRHELMIYAGWTKVSSRRGFVIMTPPAWWDDSIDLDIYFPVN